MELRFPGQKEHEEIMLMVKKHWICDLKVAIMFITFGAMPLLLYFIFVIKLSTEINQNYQLLIFFLFSFYLLFVLLFTYISWLKIELDILIVTNERIINHDQVSFFHREVSETHLEQIQDIKGSEKGLLQTIFHFGRMEIRTAADLVVFRLQYAENPFVNARKILDIRDKFIAKIKH